jgi:membrane associated rhomboid family serine protease
MSLSGLLLANVQFLLGWFLLAWVITFIELEFWRKGGNSLPALVPWSLPGLIGIFTAPFLHRSWNHLRGNTLPFFILGGLVLLRQPLDLIVITLAIALFSGIVNWLFGRVFAVRGNKVVNVSYAGLSQVIFGYAGFLLALFYFDLTIASAIALGITVLLFGRRLWLMVPSKKLTRARIAWDGHLIGFIVGAFVAAYLPYLRPLSLSLLQAINVPTQFQGIVIAGTVIDENFYRQGLPPLIAQYGPLLFNRLSLVLRGLLVVWIAAFIDFQLLNGWLHRNLGIRPWTLRGLVGIPVAPVLHGNWNHLSDNTTAFLIFAGLIVLVRPDDFALITIAITLLSGLLIYLTAASANYIGASSLIFGYIGFLLSLYYFESNQASLLLFLGTIAILVLIDLIWFKIKPKDLFMLKKSSFIKGILPDSFSSSWGHFLGFLSGVLTALYLPGLKFHAAYLLKNFNFNFLNFLQ